MFYFITVFAVCFFALIGVTCTLLCAIDSYTAARSGIYADIVVTDTSGCKDEEYAVMMLETALRHSALCGMTRNIILPSGFPADEELSKRLFEQFENLKKKEE